MPWRRQLCLIFNQVFAILFYALILSGHSHSIIYKCGSRLVPLFSTKSPSPDFVIICLHHSTKLRCCLFHWAWIRLSVNRGSRCANSSRKCSDDWPPCRGSQAGINRRRATEGGNRELVILAMVLTFGKRIGIPKIRNLMMALTLRADALMQPLRHPLG